MSALTAGVDTPDNGFYSEIRAWGWGMLLESWQMCAKVSNEKGLWECPAGKENHAWDCSVYNLVAADVPGLRFWRKPGSRSNAQGAKAKKSVVNQVAESTCMSG